MNVSTSKPIHQSKHSHTPVNTNSMANGRHNDNDANFTSNKDNARGSSINTENSESCHSITPVYYSQLYVHKDSSYTSFEQLHNSIFAYNDETSLSGYHSLRFYIREYYLLHSNFSKCAANSSHTASNESKSTINTNSREVTLPFFSQCIRTGAHAKSIQAVLSRQADVLCLDEHVRLSLSKSPSGRDMLDYLRPIVVPSLAEAMRNRNNTNNNNTNPAERRNTSNSNNIDNDDDKNNLSGKNINNIMNNEDRTDTCISNSSPHAYIPSLSSHYPLDTILSTADGRLGPNPLQPVLASNRLSPQLQQRILKAFLQVLFSAETKA